MYVSWYLGSECFRIFFSLTQEKALFPPKGFELLLSLLEVVRNFPMLPVCVRVVFSFLCVCVISLFRSVSNPGFVCEWSGGEGGKSSGML